MPLQDLQFSQVVVHAANTAWLCGLKKVRISDHTLSHCHASPRPMIDADKALLASTTIQSITRTLDLSNSNSLSRVRLSVILPLPSLFHLHGITVWACG